MFNSRYHLEVQVHYNQGGYEDYVEFIIYDAFFEVNEKLHVISKEKFPYYASFGMTIEYEAIVLAMNRAYDDDQVYISEVGEYVDEVIVADMEQVWFVK